MAPLDDRLAEIKLLVEWIDELHSDLDMRQWEAAKAAAKVIDGGKITVPALAKHIKRTQASVALMVLVWHRYATTSAKDRPAYAEAAQLVRKK